MVFLGNYLLLEMLVSTVESKADFFITPGKGRREDSGLERRGREHSALLAPQSVRSGEQPEKRHLHCSELVCLLLHWEPSAPRGMTGDCRKEQEYHTPSSERL